MPILLIEHRVQDFDAWKAAFDSDPVGREEGGVRRYRISRPIDDPNLVFVALEFDGSDEAEAFREKLRALWSRIEAEGLIEGPQASILEVVEAKDL
jgi:hypothetical protein